MSRGILSQRVQEALWDGAGGPGEYHTRAKVVSVSGSKVGVRLKGSSTVTSCSKLNSYSPKVGDVALVLVMASGCIAIGTIG